MGNSVNTKQKNITNDKKANVLIKAIYDKNIDLYSEIMETNINISDLWHGAPLYYNIISSRLMNNLNDDLFIKKLKLNNINFNEKYNSNLYFNIKLISEKKQICIVNIFFSESKKLPFKDPYINSKKKWDLTIKINNRKSRYNLSEYLLLINEKSPEIKKNLNRYVNDKISDRLLKPILESCTFLLSVIRKENESKKATIVPPPDAPYEDELIEENNDKTLCSICMVEQKNILFDNCKHCIVCEECANAINKCPLCNIVITKKIKIFI